MLERKIREVVGCLKTLKAAQNLAKTHRSQYDEDNDGAVYYLETDCIVKLALLYPLLEKGDVPIAICDALKAVEMSVYSPPQGMTMLAFRRRDGGVELVDVYSGQRVPMKTV